MPNDISLALKAQLALQSAGFDYTRSLGQNFIFDEELLNEIACCAGVGSGTNVLEIGPGAGMLTAVMAEKGANVVSVELDKSLAPVLDKVLEGFDKVQIVYADALKCDLNALTQTAFNGEKYIICANLPYYITADFILKAVTLENEPESITLMLQKEAAQRVLSRVGDEGWCTLSAIVSYFREGELLMDVPRDRFTPAPHVDSALVRLTPRSGREVPSELERDFVAFIKSAFAMRRKTLSNNISSAYAINKAQAADLLSSLGFDPRERGEALTIPELSRVFLRLKEIYEQ
ncbi:MAG: ribosomal RNA small subunit methyltransferase A [Clostridia bacterium]|nr:ribosomal RNA small subunit methyltransferase A [Clostridia bacterium]